MNSRILIIVLFVLFNLSHVKADSHDGNEKDILKKAKEINEKVIRNQAEQKSTISAEIGGEEPLPLNDHFVGDASLGGSAA